MPSLVQNPVIEEGWKREVNNDWVVDSESVQDTNEEILPHGFFIDRLPKGKEKKKRTVIPKEETCSVNWWFEELKQTTWWKEEARHTFTQKFFRRQAGQGVINHNSFFVNRHFHNRLICLWISSFWQRIIYHPLLLIESSSEIKGSWACFGENEVYTALCLQLSQICFPANHFINFVLTESCLFV